MSLKASENIKYKKIFQLVTTCFNIGFVCKRALFSKSSYLLGKLVILKENNNRVGSQKVIPYEG